MSEKAYKRQLAIIWTIIIVAIVLIIVAAGAMLFADDGVKQVEKNETFVTVESYIGKTYEEVNADGLKFEKVEVFSDAEKGVVIQQSVAEGTSVKRGTTIVLNVSKGNSEVSVPVIVGKTEDEAVKALRDNGFEVEIHYILNYDKGELAGTVKECSPSAGNKVAYGSKVTVVIYGDDQMTTTTTTTRPSGETAPPETTTQPTTAPTTTITTTTTTTETTTVDSGAEE